MKLLVVEPRNLFPRDSGAKILSSNVLAHLGKQHEVTIVVNIDPHAPAQHLEEMRQICREVVTVEWKEIRNFTLRFYMELAKGLFTGRLYAVKKFCTPALRERVAGLAAEGGFDMVLCDTLSTFMPHVDFSGTPCVVLAHNVEHRLRQRQAGRARGLKAAYLRYYARKTRAFETKSFETAEQVVTVSAADAEHIRNVLKIEHVTPLPPGVDAEYFSPGGPESPEPGIVFTGSMDWQANMDASEFFVLEVLPLIRKAFPRVRFSIVGRRPPPHIRALGQADPEHVEVTGTVDDIRPYLARARVAVVPVIFGSGIKIKVFEAMAMAKPVVVSTIGAEGLPLVHRENVLIADTPAEIAASCVELLQDGDLRRRLGERARATVLAGHDWSVVAAELGRICEDVARRRKKR